MPVHHNAHSDIAVDIRVYVDTAFFLLKMGNRIAFLLLAQFARNVLYVVMSSVVCLDLCAMSR